MISNTHGGGENPWPVAVSGGLHFTRPESSPPTPFVCDSPPVGPNRAAMRPGVVAHLFRRAYNPLLPGTADGRADPASRRARHLAFRDDETSFHVAVVAAGKR